MATASGLIAKRLAGKNDYARTHPNALQFKSGTKDSGKKTEIGRKKVLFANRQLQSHPYVREFGNLWSDFDTISKSKAFHGV